MFDFFKKKILDIPIFLRAKPQLTDDMKLRDIDWKWVDGHWITVCGTCGNYCGQCGGSQLHIKHSDWKD